MDEPWNKPTAATIEVCVRLRVVGHFHNVKDLEAAILESVRAGARPLYAACVSLRAAALAGAAPGPVLGHPLAFDGVVVAGEPQARMGCLVAKTPRVQPEQTALISAPN